MNRRDPDILVIGAGIVGTACARALAKSGFHVTILDHHIVGGGATAAGMGHIVVMDDSEAQFELTRYSRDAWTNLAPQLPATAEWESCGTLWVAADELEMQEVLRKAAYYHQRGVRTEVLNATKLYQHEPQLRPGLTGALLVPDDAVIYPPVAAQWMIQETETPIKQILGAKVCQLGHQEVTLQDGTKMRAGHIVVATGSWVRELLPDLPVRPRKGHLLITDRYPGFLHHQIIELGYLKSAHAVDTDSVAFNAQPRKTGQILLGSSRQYGEEDTRVNESIMHRMLARALEYLPGMSDVEVLRIWTGLRAATPDKLPVIGPVNEEQSIWVASGHEGLGITTSLGTADMLCAGITGQPSPLEPASFRPQRFAYQPGEEVNA